MGKEICTAYLAWLGQLCRSCQNRGVLFSCCDLFKNDSIIGAIFPKPNTQGFVRPCTYVCLGDLRLLTFLVSQTRPHRHSAGGLGGGFHLFTRSSLILMESVRNCEMEEARATDEHYIQRGGPTRMGARPESSAFPGPRLALGWVAVVLIVDIFGLELEIVSTHILRLG